MTDKFEIRLTEWLEGFHGSPEERFTLTPIQFVVNDRCLTEVEDFSAARAVRSKVRVSGYWFAYWLGSNWWRLGNEGLLPFSRSDRRWVDWRLTHELPGIGHGFIWPPVSIASAGAGALYINTIERPTTSPETEPIRYLGRIDEEFISFQAFERGVDAFIGAVIQRLDACELRTELHDLWQIVLEERSDPAVAMTRRREALLGFEPEQAPAHLLRYLVEKEHSIGQMAIDEIATAARVDSADEIERISAALSDGSITARIRDSKRMQNEFFATVDSKEPPAEQGMAAAHIVRKKWGLNGQPITREALARELQIPNRLKQTPSLKRGPVVALGVRQRSEDDSLKLLLHSNNPHGQRFEMARIIADHVFVDVDESWRPITTIR